MEVLEARGYSNFVRIDSGGQANVYKTNKGSRTLAIKVVPVEPENQLKLDEELRRELSIVKSVHYVSCIRVEELFRTKSRVYIVMDFMPNGTIGAVVRKIGPLCEWNCVCWFPAIAYAIKYLHENKVAHRDIKLDNILLDANFNPIVSDFGFARLVPVSSSTGTGAIMSSTYCGTASYNPPEILKQRPYEPFPGDIWCLGVALFVMANSFYPFDRREGVEQMYAKQMSRDYRLQAQIEAKVTAPLKDLIRQLLEPVPEERPLIGTVCQHEWFPAVLKEAHCLSGNR